jgi:hypothetical protein
VWIWDIFYWYTAVVWLVSLGTLFLLTFNRLLSVTRNFDPNNYNIIVSKNQEFFRKLYFPRTVILWNNLPPNIKAAHSLQIFNTTIDNFTLKFVVQYPICQVACNLWCNIWTTTASVSPGYPNTRKQCMRTRARSARVFIHCFRVFGYPGETRARVVYMASQMNRDVTECLRLLIWIEFLTKHNVIRNSIQVTLYA